MLNLSLLIKVIESCRIIFSSIQFNPQVISLLKSRLKLYSYFECFNRMMLDGINYAIEPTQ